MYSEHDADVLAAVDRSAVTTAVAGADLALVKRIAGTLRRAGIDVAGIAPDLRELVLECADIDVHAVIWTVGDIGEVESGARLLRGRMPGAQLVVVAREIHSPKVGRVLGLGVAGLVRQRDASIALAATVAAVCVGQIAVPRDLRAHVAPHPLTARERAVFDLVQEGLTNSEIAARLYLAESTVKTHVSVIYSKLGVSSRKEVRALLVDPPDKD